MTYQNDPNRDFEMQRRRDMNRTGISPWVWGGLAAVLFVLALMFMPGNHNNTGQSTAQRPAVTSPTATAPVRETTGSGAASSTIPNNPSGTVPQKDMNQPAPQPNR
jgi:hypothetical protein